MLSFSIFVYSTVKGGFILNHYINDDAFTAMHPTYYACVIWCFVTSLLVFLLSAASPFGLRRLKKQRVLKHYNEQGQEVDEQGKIKPRNASLLRLISLAKPVSIIVAFILSINHISLV